MKQRVKKLIKLHDRLQRERSAAITKAEIAKVVEFLLDKLEDRMRDASDCIGKNVGTVATRVYLNGHDVPAGQVVLEKAVKQLDAHPNVEAEFFGTSGQICISLYPDRS